MRNEIEKKKEQIEGKFVINLKIVRRRLKKNCGECVTGEVV